MNEVSMHRIVYLAAMLLVPLAGCGGQHKEAAPPPSPDTGSSAETSAPEPAPDPSPKESSPEAPPQGGLGLRGEPAETGKGQKTKGSLSKEAIRATVHRNIQDIKDCYERSLETHPELTGAIMVKFIIALDGTVSMAAIAKTTLSLPELEACIAGAVKRWQFPKPEGGIVIVSYPFKLAPPPPDEK